MLSCYSLVTLLSWINIAFSSPKHPHIVFMLTDDLGWNSAWNNPETITPTLDEMSSSGLILGSFYTYKYCSPTRGSFLTGRFPYKLCASRGNLPTTAHEGINLGYTFLSKRLQTVGYITYHIGKWHQGLFSPPYIPVSRGFNYSYGFLDGGEDHFNQRYHHCNIPGVFVGEAVDIYNCSNPGYGDNGTYNSYIYTKDAIRLIEKHNEQTGEYSDIPMFLYFAIHNTHAPIQAPQKYIDMYDFNQSLRNTFNGMVSVVDETVKNVTNALKSNKLWNNTLFIWTTDNGAPVNVAGSNKPLRGSKTNNFEGGVHTPAFVSGGLLPDKMRGKKLNGLIHICDMYATFLTGLIGVDANDTNPNAPSSIDSINMWPYLSGDIEESPRNIIVHDHRMYTNVTQGAIRSGDYKLIMMNESEASWYGQFSPNTSWNNNMNNIYACSVEQPCLFNISNDPTEHNDISLIYPNVTKDLIELFYSYNNEYHPPQKQPPNDQNNYCQAVADHKGFQVPWVFNLTS